MTDGLRTDSDACSGAQLVERIESRGFPAQENIRIAMLGRAEINELIDVIPRARQAQDGAGGEPPIRPQ